MFMWTPPCARVRAPALPARQRATSAVPIAASPTSPGRGDGVALAMCLHAHPPDENRDGVSAQPHLRVCCSRDDLLCQRTADRCITVSAEATASAEDEADAAMTFPDADLGVHAVFRRAAEGHSPDKAVRSIGSDGQRPDKDTSAATASKLCRGPAMRRAKARPNAEGGVFCCHAVADRALDDVCSLVERTS